ncbi:MAG: hemoglobin [Thiomicrorhabdus sp.]|nr:MAG: hemoglobin [Thiomicrorhabdus sp.]
MTDSIDIQPYGFGDGTYQAVGGHDGLIRLVDHFYDAMEQLPQAEKIRGMHNPDLTVSRDKLVYFLSGWMGGPQIYSDKYGGINIPMAHAHILIDEHDRDAWLKCMQVALEQLEYPESLQVYLLEQLYRPAERIRQVSQMTHNG